MKISLLHLNHSTASSEEINSVFIKGDHKVENLNYRKTYSHLIHAHLKLRESDLLVVGNSNHAIEPMSCIAILHAMILGKPVLLYEPPTFTLSVDRFSKEIVKNKLSKLLICNLEMLDEDDINDFLSPVLSVPVNYVLTKHHYVLIKAKLRQHFRELLNA